MTEPAIAPYGAWESPFPISLLTAGVVAISEIKATGGVRWWLEGRPDEKGRQVLIRRDADGTTTRLTPEGFNARTRVQEYGGGAYLVDGDLIVVSDFTTGRLNRVTAPEQLEPLTPERAWRFADMVVDRARNRLIAVREDHEPATLERHGEAENSIVAIDLSSGDASVLLEGADFYAAPRPSPDGGRLAWLEWRHPNMPWDGTELRVGDVRDDGTIGAATTVAGGPSDWISQPRWSPDRVLHFVAEPDGWMNIHRLVDGRVESIAPLEAEYTYPDWLFGFSNYGFLADGSIVAIARSGGRDHIHLLSAEKGLIGHLDLPFTEMSGLAVDGAVVVLRAASPSAGSAVVELDPTTGTWTTLRRAMTHEFEPADIAAPRSIEFPTTGGRTAFGLFYPPSNRSVHGPEGELPPLVVTSHGGPTAAAFAALTVSVQLFTSRGFAVLDVDYGGSTGYGRDYRKRLEGQWGVVDLDDCVNGARWLADQGLVDGERLAIRGGSASGYTTLCAMTFSDAFRAGTSYFGIGDLETFRSETHKFESRYDQTLIGPWPESKHLYHDRSPINFLDRISCPVLILQGADDRVVPPAQAEEIVDALWEKQLPHAYLLFPGEDHGFRAAENIIRSFEAELSFYGQVFGFTPADTIEPIEVAFLGAPATKFGAEEGRNRVIPPLGAIEAATGAVEPTVGAIEAVVVLLVAATALALLARRIGIPYPILLVLGGLALGFVPGLPTIELEPDLVFLLFLPPILFGAGYFTSVRDFKRNLRAITLLSVGLVIATMVAVAVIAQALVPTLGWAPAFVLGAIVAPPDAVAATSVFQRLGVPRRVVTILEGESLVNDATALVAYRVALIAVLTGTFSPANAGLTFVAVGVGGIAFGLLMGIVISWVLMRVDDPVFSVVLTFLAPVATYLPAEQLGISGVLATVAAGIWVGRHAPRQMSSSVRVAGAAAWQVLLFLINGMVFILIGAQLPSVLEGLGDRSPAELFGLAAVISAVVILVRIAWVYPGTYLPRALSEAIRTNEPFPMPRNVFIVSWAGMRGVVSLAAALALPLTLEDGTPFPERDLIIFLAFAVILATLVGQGLTLPVFIRALGVVPDSGEAHEEAHARMAAAEAAVERIEELAEEWPGHLELIDTLRAQYAHRASHADAHHSDMPLDEAEQETLEHREIRAAVIDAEREALLEMRERGAVSDEVFRRVERDLDLEELRMEA